MYVHGAQCQEHLSCGEPMLSNVARDNVAQLRTSPFHISCTSPTRNIGTSINNGIVTPLVS